MVGRYNPRLTEAISFACPSNTGDSLALAQEVKAATTRGHMQFISSMPWALETSPGKGILATIWSRLFGAIYVNKEGRRFVNEMEEPLIIAEKLAELKDTTMFTIHDERMLKTMRQAEKPIILGGFMSSGWSEERFNREAEDGKLIKRAASLRELAQKIEANPEVLEDTITKYNTYVDSGRDQEFGRPNLSVKIDEPSFYAIPTKPYVISSYGGLRVNPHLQVLDEAANPITGLYAAGMSVGGVHGKRMASGNGLGWATTSGRLVGEIVTLNPDIAADD
jgi:fumarate reductase flavoprotein subunit